MYFIKLMSSIINYIVLNLINKILINYYIFIIVLLTVGYKVIIFSW